MPVPATMRAQEYCSAAIWGPDTKGKPPTSGRAEPEQEILGGADAVLLGERVDGVLLGVGRDHLALSPSVWRPRSRRGAGC